MDGLFIILSRSLEANYLMGYAASFCWGLLSIILSPCHLSGIALIIAYLSSTKNSNVKNTFIITLLFSIGYLVNVLIIGIITGLLGRMIGDIGLWGNIFVSLILIFVGLYLMEIIKLNSFGGLIQSQKNQKNYFHSFILGLLFGLSVGPCTFAFMAPILSIVFGATNSNLILSAFLVIFFALGNISVIIVAGLSFKLISKLINWNNETKILIIIKKVCGGLVIVSGLYILITAAKKIF